MTTQYPASSNRLDTNTNSSCGAPSAFRASSANSSIHAAFRADQKISKVTPKQSSSFMGNTLLKLDPGAEHSPADLLAQRAIAILLAGLRKENVVSHRQHKALARMMRSMARQALGLDTGRYAYSLPCGGGKTQGAIALIVAAWELGMSLTFAVATSQVEDLCEFKRQLMGHRIPESTIGLWHSLKVNQDKAGKESGYASLPATPEDENRPILLLSHQKIKKGNADLYRRKSRNLLIWDESLLATEAHAIPVSDMQLALDTAKWHAPCLVPPLENVISAVASELTALHEDPERMPRILHGLLTRNELDSVRDAVRIIPGMSGHARAMKKTVLGLGRLLELPVSVAETGNGNRGNGVLRYEVLVPEELDNIAILDASHSIRLLTQADRSIIDRTSQEMREYRQYHNVTVRVIKLRTGKAHLTGNEEASLPAAREIAEYAASVPADEGILIFVVKDALGKLRKNLEKAGVDLSRRITVDGDKRPRIEFLTWGQHTARNDMRHCRHVIMAGVLRRNPLDLAASLTGQQQEPQPRRNSRATLAEVSMSEVAHAVLQAMHRGACRVSDADGEALQTSVLILDYCLGKLPGFLYKALPGATWETASPARKPHADSRTRRAIDQIVQYLTGPNAPAERVSVTALRKTLGIALSRPVFKDALDIALADCSARHHIRWRRDGRSLVRDSVQ